VSRKLIYPKTIHAETKQVVVSRETSTNAVVSSALNIIANQIEVMRVSSSMGGSLEDNQLKNLRVLIQSLVELRKDEREQEKHDNIHEKIKAMTDEELFAYYKSLENKEKLPESK